MGRDHTDTWFFFGDSVTLGVNDNVTPGGFVSRLALKGAQKGLYEFPPATFYNLGARRQTMAQIQDRFKREYEARLMPGIRSRFAFCTGTVDALRGTAPDLLNEAKGIAPPLFICPPPLFDDGPRECLSRFAALASDICGRLNIPCVNIFDTLMSRSYVALLTDHIHPGPEGNELVASLLPRCSPSSRQQTRSHAVWDLIHPFWTTPFLSLNTHVE